MDWICVEMRPSATYYCRCVIVMVSALILAVSMAMVLVASLMESVKKWRHFRKELGKGR